SENRSADYEASSISLPGAVAMGTGVMIGAGILALTGQMAELAGELYLLAFAGAAIVAGFSAYSYVRLASAYPSAGGIAMFLAKAYGKTAWTGAFALLMYFSMVVNESLVARTFGTYALQPFDIGPDSWLVPVLGVALLGFAFLVNVLGNQLIQTTSFVTAFLKIGGLVVFGVVILWTSGISAPASSTSASSSGVGGFLAAVALGILAYKGFTTITNSGEEITEPHRNIGRAIIASIVLCLAVYLLVALAVGSNLSVDEIVAARDYALAEAARPVFGDVGLWFTVAFAIVATASGVVASVFAVSRMLAMLTDMKLVPHSHFGMPGTIQHHTLVYTVVIAMVLTVFLDLSRIASVGAIFYIVMDMAIHWGLLRRLRQEVQARASVLVAALVLDGVVLAAFVVVKASSDTLVVWAAGAGLLAVFVGERLFLRARPAS
ncbi:MAG: APC family permease, partial [Thermoleophilia bacterium]|nr:APC family permease [Thermoleophilia bacterium]